MTRGPDFAWQAVKARTKRAALRHSRGVGVHFSPDGLTYFTDSPNGQVRGGYLVSPAHPDGVFLHAREVHDTEYSPDSKFVGIEDDEAGRVRVYTIPDGREIQSFKAQIFRFSGPSTVLYRSRCELMKLELSSNAAPEQVGRPECGGATATRDGALWMVVNPSRYGIVLSLRTYTQMLLVDGRTGVIRRRLEMPEGFFDPRLSPAGNRVCFGARNPPGIHCMQPGKQASLVLPDATPYTMVFDQEGNQALVGHSTDLLLLDFRSWTVRRVTSTKNIRYWGFAPGGIESTPMTAG